MSTPPRRALPPENAHEPRSRNWRQLLVLAPSIVALLVIAVAYAVFGPRNTATTPAPLTYAPGASDTAVPSPTTSGMMASPAPAPPGPPQPTAGGSPASTPSSDPLPTPSPTITQNEATSPDAPPEPESPPPPTAPTAGTIRLNDTSFVAPAGWVIYGDELVVEDRRVVRLSESATGTRLQALTLAEDQDLAASCQALTAAQRGAFAVTAEQLPSPVGVAPAIGEGVTCGFGGVRTSDGLANTVTFTLVRRATDAHVLVLRATVPDAVPPGHDARRDLSAMACQAGAGFGVALPLC